MSEPVSPPHPSPVGPIQDHAPQTNELCEQHSQDDYKSQGAFPV